MQAAGRGAVRDAVAAIYRAVQAETDARRPRCDISGRCCRFEQYGHRLYVTTMELAAFIHELDRQPTADNRGGCPFQRGTLCGVHTLRPFGCRVFFCDPASTQWQNDAYERFHAQLKRLHESLGVPYFYVEWRHGLRAVGLLPPLSVAAESL